MDRGIGVDEWMAPAPESVGDIDDVWLSNVLGEPVECRTIVPLGEGHMADSHLITVVGGPCEQLVLKLAAADEGSKLAAGQHRAYEVEAGFYRELAPTVGARAPRCFWSNFHASTGRYGVLLEYVASGSSGNQLVGLTPDDVSAVLEEAAALHAPRWDDRSLYAIPWLNRYTEDYRERGWRRLVGLLPEFLERHGDHLSDDAVRTVEVLGRYVQNYDRRGQRGTPTLAHGDLRADNVIVGGGRACLLDWQTVFAGDGLVDVSYLLGGSVSVEVRREIEVDQVREYHSRLLSRGVDLSWDDCWESYRRYAFEGLYTAVVSSTRVKRSDRGDRLFVAMTERAAQHAADLESERLITTP